MADVLSPAQRSFCMSRIRGRDTGPELDLRRAAFRIGLRFRVRSHLTGRPDLVFPGARLAVFVDGCFWHRCPEHAVAPRRNAAFWAAKIAANVERDRRVDAALEGEGWRVLRFWEHEVRENAAEVAERLREAVSRGRRQRRASD